MYKYRLPSLSYSEAHARRHFIIKWARHSNRRPIDLDAQAEPILDDARAWGVDSLILEILQQGILSPEPFSIAHGQQMVEQYRQLFPDFLLTWGELVSGGWIRVVWGRWEIPEWLGLRQPSGDSSDSGRFGHFFHWLRQARREHRVSLMLALPDIAAHLQHHKTRYPNAPSLETLYTLKLLQQSAKGETFLGKMPEWLSSLTPWLYARLWDQTSWGPTELDQRLTWWIHLCRLGGLWWNCPTLLTITTRKQLLKAAWQRLLLEDDLVGWEGERKKTIVLTWARSRSTATPEQIARHQLTWPANSSLFEQAKWWENDAARDSVDDNIRSELRILAGWLLIWGSRDRRDPSSSILSSYLAEAPNRPFLFGVLHSVGRESPEPAADLLLSPEPVATATGLMLVADYWFAPDGSIREEVQEEQATLRAEIFKDGLEIAFFRWSRESDLPKVATAISEIFSWLAEHVIPFSRRRRSDNSWLQDRVELFLKVLGCWPDVRSGKLPIAPKLFLERLGPELIKAIAARAHDGSFVGLRSELHLLLWLMDQHLLDETWTRTVADLVIESYRRTLLPREQYWRSTFFPDLAGWTALAVWLQEHDLERFAHWLRPVDFRANVQSLAHLAETERVDPAWTLVHHIRAHLRLLSWLLVSWPSVGTNAVSEVLVKTFAEYLDSFILSREDLADGHINVLGGQYAPLVASLRLGDEASLIDRLCEAIGSLSDDNRITIVRQIVAKSDDIALLTHLLQHLHSTNEKSLLIDRVVNIVSSDQPLRLHGMDLITSTVDTLIDQREASLAETLIHRLESSARRFRKDDWEEWAFRAMLRIQFLNGQYKQIAEIAAPVSLVTSERVKNTVEFVRALVDFERGDYQAASDRFAALHADDPHTVSYSANFFAAQVALRLARIPVSSRLSPEQARDINEILTMGERMFSEYPPEVLVRIQPGPAANQLLLLLRLHDWARFWTIYYALPTEWQLSPEVGVSAIEAWRATGHHEAARQLLGSMKARHGSSRELLKMESDLSHALPLSTRPATSTEQEQAGSPYIVGPPLREPSRFFGRADLINRILEGLIHASIVLTGPRRSGKTSLLHRLEERCQPSWKVLFVDLQEYSGELDQFLPDLVRGIVTQLGIEPPDNGLRSLSLRELRQRLRAKNAPPLLLLLDEIGVLNARRDIADQLRVLSKWDNPRVRLVVAGTPADLSRLSVGIGSAPLNEFVMYQLDELTEAESKELLEAPVRGAFKYSPDAIAHLLLLGGCRPFQLNLLGNLAWELARRRGDGRITKEDVEAAEQRAPLELERWFREFCGELDPTTRAMLPDLIEAGSVPLRDLYAHNLKAAGLAIGRPGQERIDPLFVAWWRSGRRP